MWLFLVLLAPALGLHLNKEPPPPTPLHRSSVETRWLDVRVNHFDATNTDTFPMRFYYNSRQTSDRNIVIFVGGEWEITEGWVTDGLAYDIAGFTGAGLFYTEHRYYGLTRPTNGTSVSELRFLTVDQALADLAQFITYVKSNDFENGRYRNAKVLLVGCSYAGSMATWMRVQYPHLVDGAFSDSGPLHAQHDFPEYLTVVGQAIASQGGNACYNSVAQATAAVAQLLTSTAGRAQVSQAFNTCTPLTASALDLATFSWSGLVYAFAGLAQYAGPGDIQEACAQLTSPDISDPVERLAQWTIQQFPGETCIETRFSELIQIYSNTSFDSPIATGRAWLYQTCVEYGWYQSTAGESQPFGSGVPVEYFQQMCTDFFSSFFDANRTQYGISRTNLFFGGLTQLPDRVITVQGQFDPWHPMGPGAEHARSTAPVHFVPEISHCRIIYSLNNSETESVREVKLHVINFMNEIVHGVMDAGAERAALSLVLLLGVALSLL
ncbi:putative serine protease K12H4.7 [Ostrinia nubilalis]|uniref:putative serine protease K12H4.7 n=1 Tax=Ostrinia nubilalis TaxID=29057 RepID=UPI0030822953